MTATSIAGNWNRRGFTLFELLVVIAVAGIMLAVAIPYLGQDRGGSQQAMDEARKTVSLAVGSARSRAMLSRTTAELATSEHSLVLSGKKRFGLPDGVRVNGYEVQGRDSEAAGQPLRFSPRGRTDWAVLWLESGDLRKSLLIRPFGGKVVMVDDFIPLSELLDEGFARVQ